MLSVVGTRPNFMKIAPIAAELRRRGERFEHVIVHTGQHYDDAMSSIFLDELGIGPPDHFLDVGSGSHAQQTARVMERLEPVLLDEQPDVLLVPGDVNSTLAAAVTGAKLGIRVGHVEAGLRSFDRTMPEEINRTVADSLSELLFIHSPEARDHLLREGAPERAIHDVGNTMIDTLVALRPRIDALDPPAAHGLPPGGYLLVTNFYDNGDPRARILERSLVESGVTPGRFRTYAEQIRYFEGLEMVEPGLVCANEWRPDQDTLKDSPTHDLYCAGLGRKP